MTFPGLIKAVVEFLSEQVLVYHAPGEEGSILEVFLLVNNGDSEVVPEGHGYGEACEGASHNNDVFVVLDSLFSRISSHFVVITMIVGCFE